jgi:hypothetical protein
VPPNFNSFAGSSNAKLDIEEAAANNQQATIETIRFQQNELTKIKENALYQQGLIVDVADELQVNQQKLIVHANAIDNLKLSFTTLASTLAVEIEQNKEFLRSISSDLDLLDSVVAENLQLLYDELEVTRQNRERLLYIQRQQQLLDLSSTRVPRIVQQLRYLSLVSQNFSVGDALDDRPCNDRIQLSESTILDTTIVILRPSSDTKTMTMSDLRDLYETKSKESLYPCTPCFDAGTPPEYKGIDNQDTAPTWERECTQSSSVSFSCLQSGDIPSLDNSGTSNPWVQATRDPLEYSNVTFLPKAEACRVSVRAFWSDSIYNYLLQSVQSVQSDTASIETLPVNIFDYISIDIDTVECYPVDDAPVLETLPLRFDASFYNAMEIFSRVQDAKKQTLPRLWDHLTKDVPPSQRSALGDTRRITSTELPEQAQNSFQDIIENRYWPDAFDKRKNETIGTPQSQSGYWQWNGATVRRTLEFGSGFWAFGDIENFDLSEGGMSPKSARLRWGNETDRGDIQDRKVYFDTFINIFDIVTDLARERVLSGQVQIPSLDPYVTWMLENMDVVRLACYGPIQTAIVLFRDDRLMYDIWPQNDAGSGDSFLPSETGSVIRFSHDIEDFFTGSFPGGWVPENGVVSRTLLDTADGSVVSQSGLLSPYSPVQYCFTTSTVQALELPQSNLLPFIETPAQGWLSVAWSKSIRERTGRILGEFPVLFQDNITSLEFFYSEYYQALRNETSNLNSESELESMNFVSWREDYERDALEINATWAGLVLDFEEASEAARRALAKQFRTAEETRKAEEAYDKYGDSEEVCEFYDCLCALGNLSVASWKSWLDLLLRALAFFGIPLVLFFFAPKFCLVVLLIVIVVAYFS